MVLHTVGQYGKDDLYYFTGRSKELQQILQQTKAPTHTPKVLHLYGIAGVGKSFLLQKLMNKWKQRHQECVYLDGKLIENIKELSIKQYHHPFPASDLISINQLPTIIIIDHFDNVLGLEHWLSKEIKESPQQNVFIVLVGRKPLSNSWFMSPTFQTITTSILLEKLTFQEVEHYVEKRGILDKRHLYKLWHLSMGHPLTLSISCSSLNIQEKEINILENIIQLFLHEIPGNPALRSILDIAVMMHTFNEESLNFVHDKPVNPALFDQLTTLSFIHHSEEGWYVDKFVRQMIKDHLHKRNPSRFESISKKCVSFYRQKMKHVTNRSRLLHYMTEFIYHLGDSLIETSLFHTFDHKKFYLEAVDETNFHEIEAYFQRRKVSTGDYTVDYYNRFSTDYYSFNVTESHNQKENELINLEELVQLGYHLFTIVRDEYGQLIGLTIIIPIHKKTLPYLKKAPVSRSYFNQLSDKEWKEFNVSEDKNAGWFIRMIDVVHHLEVGTRSYLLFSLLPLLLSGGRIIASTPLKMYQQIMERFGFEKVEGATHYDYGPNSPSNTYLVDVTGSRLMEFLDSLANQFNRDAAFQLEKKQFPFSPREYEVAKFIMEGYKNEEIAQELSISIVTVKKHVSNMFKKVGVKNRSQLIRKLMETIPNLDY